MMSTILTGLEIVGCYFLIGFVITVLVFGADALWMRIRGIRDSHRSSGEAGLGCLLFIAWPIMVPWLCVQLVTDWWNRHVTYRHLYYNKENRGRR